MISRNWRAVAHRERAEEFVRFLKGETFPKIARIDGFVKATILQRDVESGTEFLIVSVWKSEEAIKKFAGEVPTLAVVPPEVQAMMVEYDKYANHYEIGDEFQPG